MTKDKEPLPCPLCGEMPHKYEYENERRYSCMNMACPMWNKYLSLEQWNRRSLTAAPDGYVRYCHECNHTGLVEPGHLTCCPDSKAAHVPAEVARLARAGFEKLYCEPQHTGLCPLCDQRAKDGANMDGKHCVRHKRPDFDCGAISCFDCMRITTEARKQATMEDE